MIWLNLYGVLVEHNIIGEMSSQYFIGMLLWVSNCTKSNKFLIVN